MSYLERNYVTTREMDEAAAWFVERLKPGNRSALLHNIEFTRDYSDALAALRKALVRAVA